MSTQQQRRVKYGINVIVAAAAAVAIVVLLNWIADRQVRRNLPPEVRRFVRYDLTATRSYSLSKQTLEVLKGLKDDYRIVTLLSGDDPALGVLRSEIEQGKSLIDEYASYSNRVTVEHVDPGLQVTRVEQFHKELIARYESRLTPLRGAVDQGVAALDAVRRDTAAMLKPVRTILEDATLTDGQLKEFVRSVAQAFGRFEGDLTLVSEEVKAAVDQTPPNYAAAKRTLETLLAELDEQVYAVALDQFQSASKGEGTPASVREGLLELVERITASRKGVQDALAALRAAQSDAEYDRLRSQLASEFNTVVVVGPRQVQVLKLSDLFRAEEASEPSPEQEQRKFVFLGEERITGALANMSLEHKPLVVFVSSGQSAPLGRGNPQTTYNQVAQRLRNMNFDVQSWSPMPGRNPMTGQPEPPSEPPQPKEGQRAAWIVLPSEPNPMNPFAAQAPQQVVELVRAQVEAGQGVMMMLMAQPMMGMGGEDPLAGILNEWGITPQLDRVVMREEVTPDRRRLALAQHEMSRWPGESPITAAMSGASGVMLMASPIQFEAQGSKSKVQPLVRIAAAGGNLWSDTNLTDPTKAKFNPAAAQEQFVVGVSAEREEQRLVAIADPVWATDYVTTYGPLGPGSAQLGAVFPGNSDLFVNCVYWLTRMDQLIAAGARSQDIRRVSDLSPAAMSGIRWMLLLGLPLLVAAGGLGVYLVRRSG